MATQGNRLNLAIEQAYSKGRRTPVNHLGKRAVIVPEEDAHLLEAIENFLDLKDVRQRRTRAAARKEKPVSWSSARKRLGW
jgi:hypothetical protein